MLKSFKAPTIAAVERFSLVSGGSTNAAIDCLTIASFYGSGVDCVTITSSALSTISELISVR